MALTEPQLMRETTLHVAVRDGNFRPVKKIVKNVADVDFLNKNRQTPAHLAVKKGHWRILRLLLDHGASPLATDISGKSVLELAILREDENIQAFNAFTETGRVESNYYIIMAIACGTPLANFKSMICRDRKFNQWKEDYLTRACESGNNEIVRELIGRGVSPNINIRVSGCCPIVQAARYGGRDTVGILLAAGAVDLSDRDGDSAVTGAIIGHDMDLLKHLLGIGFQPVSQTGTHCVQAAVDYYLCDRFFHIANICPLTSVSMDEDQSLEESFAPLRMGGFFLKSEDRRFKVQTSEHVRSLASVARHSIRMLLGKANGPSLFVVVQHLNVPDEIKTKILNDDIDDS
jgi:ankyrin repeat protein